MEHSNQLLSSPQRCFCPLGWRTFGASPPSSSTSASSSPSSSTSPPLPSSWSSNLRQPRLRLARKVTASLWPFSTLTAMLGVEENEFYGVQFVLFRRAILQPCVTESHCSHRETKTCALIVPLSRIVVYTGDTDAAPDMILAKARDRFNMSIPDTNLTFIYLHRLHISGLGKIITVNTLRRLVL